MTLSSKVIKASQQNLARQRVAVEVPDAEEPLDLSPEVENVVDEVVSRAKSEARAILEQADADAERIRQEAQKEGHQTGYAAGYEAGRAEARALWEELRASIEEPVRLLEQSRDYLDRLNDEATLALASALTMAVFSRLRLERLDVIAAYIQELAQTVDGDRVTVFLDSSWGPRLKALEEALGESVKAVALAVDETLASGTMRAEGARDGVLAGPMLSLRALLQEVLA